MNGNLDRGCLTAAFALMALVATAVEPVAETNSVPGTNHGPAILFADTFHDFGRLQSDNIASHDFAFTNIGNEVLKIMDVQSSCGCAAVTNWQREIAPGEAGALHVLFNTGGMAGLVRKNLWVVSNDTNQPSVALQIAAYVWKWIDAMPTIAAFNFGPNLQTNRTMVIRLVSNLEEPVTLSSPQCASAAFTVRLETVTPGKEFDLYVTVNPPLDPGSLSVPIIIKTSSPKMPELNIPAYAMVQPALTVSPNRIRLPAEILEPKQVVVSILNNSSNAVSLSDPEINAAGAKVELREIQAGKVSRLVVTFPAGYQIPSNQAIELQVKSTHPRLPLVKVPVSQLQTATD